MDSGRDRRQTEKSRLLDSAREEFVAHGISRTAIGDIARRAGVSRPTLHRQCGDKNEIIAAVLLRDLRDFWVRLQTEFAELASAEDKIVEAFVLGMGEARNNPLVEAIREFDPELFSERVLDLSAGNYRMALAVIAELVADEAYPGDVVERAVDIMLRIAATLLMSPSPRLPTDTAEDARAFASAYLVPLLHASASQTSRSTAGDILPAV